jgi:Protein of unknown function (DUF1826)
MLQTADTHLICAGPDDLLLLPRSGTNLALWPRALPAPVAAWLADLDPDDLPPLTAEGDLAAVARALAMGIAALPGPAAAKAWWCDDVGILVHRWGAAARSAAAQAQIEVVRDDQCRKFHTDMVAMRLLCTYRGPGTEWVPDDAVRRNRLGGHGENRDIVRDAGAIRRLGTGDVALFLGDVHDPHRPGLVHRSPPLAGTGAVRILLRIDRPGACGCGVPHVHHPPRSRVP